MTTELTELPTIATRLRVNILRMIAGAGSGHPGGSLSAIDLVTYLYFHRMSIDPSRPDWDDRDRFVLSKGHCAPAYYVALAARGYFPEELLWTLRDIDSPLQGHPDMRKTVGVDMTTGSLGQGFSCSVGMALAAKVRKKDFQVYAVLSDGENQSGIVWEGAMAAAHNKLDNLTAIIDFNRYQVDGATRDIMNIEPVAERWSAFGWHAVECDGHDFADIHRAFDDLGPPAGKPRVIVAHTVKGKGVAEMENNVDWHGKPPTPEAAETYIAEILANSRQGGAK
jgi:transketolase